MTTPKTVKNILNDMNRTVAELQKKGILNDYRAYSIKSIGQSLFEISYPNKNEKSSIVFDKHVTGGTIMDTLLKNLQYNVLFYDKSFIHLPRQYLQVHNGTECIYLQNKGTWIGR